MGLQFFVLALALCAFSANAGVLTNDPLKVLTTSSNTFGRSFYQTLLDEYKGKNMISSPLSVFAVLSMLEYGADGKTADLLLESLHLPNDTDLIDQGFKKFFSSFNNVTGVQLDLANKIFISDGFKAKDEFLKVTEDVFQSKAEKINVGSPFEAADAVNKYVSEKTHDTIKDIVDPKKINSNTRMLLVNALYFKGQWEYKFKEHSETKFFINKDKTVDTPFMSVKSKFSYGYTDSLKAHFVKVPYKNGEYEMIIVMPDDKEGLSDMEKQLKSIDYKKIATHKENVELIMPKFKFETTFDLKDPLKQLGLADIFGSPNLKKISDDDLVVTDVTQKAFVEVNEEGTKAAAATAAHIGLKSAYGGDEYTQFLVNRPFFFLIKRGSILLFQGHVYNPKQ